MTKILIDRAVVEQALEALINTTAPKNWEVIATLRAALAEPVQEPVAWLVTDCIGERYLCFSPPLDSDQVLPLYSAPPQRPAEPQGCDHCNHPLYAATKCRVCGRAHGIGGEE